MVQTPQHATIWPGPEGAPASGEGLPAGRLARRGGPAGLVLCLTILSILAAFAGGAGCLAAFLPAAASGAVSARVALIAMAWLAGGLAVACSLWALSWLVRCQFEAAMAQRRVLAILTGVEPPPDLPTPLRAAAAAAPAAASKEPPARDADLLAAIRELSVNLLLTAEERQIKRHRQQEEFGSQLVTQIRDTTERRNFARAEELLSRLETEFPADASATQLRSALAHALAASAEEEIARAQTKAGDLMALAKFQDARDLAKLLALRYPQDPRAQGLLETVSREADAFLGEQKRRIYKDIERNVADRRWQAALAAARLFLEKFPDCTEAKLVTAQIDTLEDNARLEMVRDLRDRLRECLERKRYEEALQIAREVIRRFPGTAAAEDLAQQLPRLEELAGGRRRGHS
jgi:outer membrane protein assembly factor BamD (BamD/ComL family)